jgi:hypothetical protein
MSGAPKSNTNALKHGLYAKQFNDDQRLGLKRMAWDDFRHEEFAHRVIGVQIFMLLNEKLAVQHPDIDQVVKLSNSFAICTTTTGTHARTHAHLNGMDEQQGDALSEALSDVPFFLDDRTD